MISNSLANGQIHPSRGYRSALAQGPVTVFREARHRWHSWFFERYFRVRTAGWILEKDLDYVSADTKPYAPIGYEHIAWALRQIPFAAGDVEFVDIGCGKGRAIVAASRWPFRSVTGLELSPKLAADARRNVAAMRGARVAAQVLQMNALDYEIPATANVFYLFNPFDGATMTGMVGRIRESFERHPRKGFVIAFNHKHFERAVSGEGWIRRTYAGEFYPQFGCGLYEIG